ncbi:hypothetical protein EWM64_g10104 [Hericium alpestre]|uniref:NF-kappa-B-activating protein C-terminal domain-containing protein n=1 Tax=Hericium alpestre TaxID=135208 RepID=A0A4Y9ZKE9_9AGAM|nr:hypothetical protein EWM64_g10104 [Hericium alpestre]
MYPARRERAGDGRHFAGDGRGFGGDGQDYFESRRQQRLGGTLSIWPPSPKAPARALSPERISKKSRKHKRSRSSSVSSTEDSEEERRRREHKERKRARKEKERSDRHRHRSRRHRSRTRSEDEDERERRRSRHKSRTKSREPERRRDTRSRSADIEHDAGEDAWVEKPVTGVLAPETHKVSDVAAASTSAVVARDVSMEESDEEVGPQPAYKVNASKKVDERAYGGALLRGEGSAMAAFLQDGTDMRIPRRGEIGLESDEIASFESVGYVMSGSRHHRMNAVRIRKENQVISAEEKRGILKLQQEERERREAILREEFQELLKEKLKGTEGRSG